MLRETELTEAQRHHIAGTLHRDYVPGERDLAGTDVSFIVDPTQEVCGADNIDEQFICADLRRTGTIEQCASFCVSELVAKNL